MDPKVIEFNARFGDPEAQVVIPMIEGDLAPRLAAAADGSARLGTGRIPSGEARGGGDRVGGISGGGAGRIPDPRAGRRIGRGWE